MSRIIFPRRDLILPNRHKQGGFIINPYAFATSGGETDPHWASVVSLLHFDGPHASPVFTDQKGRAWTNPGGAVISTTDSKFGGASGSFDGFNDNISTEASADFAFPGDFTIEGWIKRNNVNPTYQALLVVNNSGGASFNLKGGKLSFGANSVSDDIVAPSLCPHSVWVHVAAIRSGTTLMLAESGVIVSSVTQTRNYVQSGTTTLGATSGYGTPYLGYMDEWRVTKGVARYTANFTPPTAPFPNS